MATSTRALLTSFILVIAAFFGSTVVVSHAARGIDRDAHFISRDAAPGIEVLSNLRAELRSFEVEAVRAADTGDTSRVDQVRRRIDSLLAEAMALPNDAQELRLLGGLQASLRAFDEAAERALQQSRSGSRSEARHTLHGEARPLCDKAAEIARELVDYEAREAREAALRIEQERVHAGRLAWQLDALAAVLSTLAALLCFRVVRQVLRVKEQNALLLRHKAEELEQFAGRVAHDILSPLSTVGLSLALAERSAPEARDALRRGAASLARVRGIVDGLLDFARSGARPEHGARAALKPIVAGLAEELTPFAAQHEAALDLGDPPDCGIACSPGVLLSLLGNLLRNAIKYLGNSQVREVSLRIRVRRARVLFEIEDTGPGIPAGLVSSIFEPYVRGVHAGVPGIGLGLATVKRLVESHGGTVGVRRGEKGGALFWFELAEATAEETAIPAAGQAQSA